jgi:3-oxoacyl-[acyl-carrier-protein] synthase II
MENSGCNPRDISYISAHGSSDPELDIAETIAIKNIFGALAYKIPISSIKGCTGNPLAAGGVLQLIATALIMHHNIIVPTANYKFSDPDCDLDYVPNDFRKAAIGTALINSHGTGGVNSSLIMRKV